MLIKTRLIQAMWFAGDTFRLFFISTPPRPGLFLSACREFLEMGSKQVFPTKIPKNFSWKNRVHIFHQITTPPQDSHVGLFLYM